MSLRVLAAVLQTRCLHVIYTVGVLRSLPLSCNFSQYIKCAGVAFKSLN